MSEERSAILIGSSQFPADPRLTPLRCPENDVDGLSKLLSSLAQGGYREVVPLKNRPHYEVLKAVNVALRHAKKDDFVLIYYSGHGKLDRAGRLYLAASNTEVQALESTSIPVATILDYVRLSNCRSVGLILDCCYSGAVGEAIFRGGVEEQLQQIQHASSGGIYILTASTGVQVAEEKAKDEYGLLTKYIIQGIEGGEADLKEDGQISMDELYEYVHQKVKQEGFQEPMKWDLGVTGQLVVARSGRMPREERRKQIRQMMLDYAREGQISDRLLSEALKVLKLGPDELHGEPGRRDDLLRQLLDKRLPLGEFMDEWYGPPRIEPIVVPPEPEDIRVVVPPPPPPWWRKHLRTIAIIMLPVLALIGWWLLSPFRQSVEPPNRAGAVKMNSSDGQNYVWIPPGEFQMGCSPGDGECDDNEKPPHTVRISRGFWLGQTEVTVGAYKRFAESTGALMPAEPVLGQIKLNAQWGDPGQPMVKVTWAEANSYCGSWAKGRLPTEAEWEWAARAGSTAASYGALDAIAWYADNSGSQRLDSARAWEQDAARDGGRYLRVLETKGNRIHQVRQKQPNAWELYDMLGNAWEWVSDWYREDYPRKMTRSAEARGGRMIPPFKGPSSGMMRVLRGGSWLNGPWDVRASSRNRDAPENRGNNIGFRCARDVIP